MHHALTLHSMANGHFSLQVHATVEYDSFPKVAQQLLESLKGSVIEKVNSADVLVWKVHILTQPFDLVFDEMTGDLSIESNSPQGDTTLKNIFDKHYRNTNPTEVTSMLSKKFLLMSIGRLLILFVSLLMAIQGFSSNFIPTTHYGLLSLGLAAIVTWLIFRFVIKPLASPFSGLVSRFKFSWKEFWSYLKRPQMIIHGLFYLLRFKGFYFGFGYILVFITITFSAPTLLENLIAKPFTQDVMVVSRKMSTNLLACGYKLKLDRYGSYFSNSYCVKRKNYRLHRNIERQQTIILSGTRSWAGDHIKSISERSKLDY